MNELHLSAIRIVPVLLATVAAFLLGGLWYSALFKNTWARLSGYTEERMNAMKKCRPMPLFFAGIIVADFVTAAAGSIFVQAFHAVGFHDGIHLGLAVWLGIATPIQFTAWLASDRPLGLYAIDTGFQLVRLALMGAILAGWS